MRIIQIINALTLGGAQVILLDLVERLRQQGHEVEILAFRDGPIGRKLRDKGFKTHILGESFLDLPAYWQLRRITKSFKPDLIHSHLFRSTFWARIARLFRPEIRLVTSIHGSETSFFHKIESLSANLSDHLIFPSKFLRNWYFNEIRAVAKNRLSVIYPGVRICPGSSIQNDNPLKIGTLSRLHPVKGIDRLLQAARILQTRNINFELYIGGDGKLKAELHSLANKLGLEKVCHFQGEIENQRDFLENLDIFVAPSRQEAFGIHACEAMERGIPVVAANIGGLPEIVENNVTGFLFDPDKIESLADKLQQIIANHGFRKKAAALSRQRVIQMFNRETAIDKHLEIYHNLTDRHKKIHFVISSGELGGGERLSLDLIKSLKLRGWNVSVTCCGADLANELKRAGIKFSSVSMNLGGIFFASRLLSDIRQNQPQLISSHLNKASLFSGIIGRLLNIPVVSHVHGMNNLTYYRNSARLIPVSSGVESHLLTQGVRPEKVNVIKNCINKRAETAKSLSGQPLKICIVAKLHKNKGHEWAIKTILENSATLPKLELHIIGDGPERQNLEKLVKERDRYGIVKFHGFIAEPEALIRQMHLALLPSLGEGIPLSLLEAMSLGLPCIATGVGGIPEIISNDVNGLLIEHHAPETLAKAITKAADPAIYKKLSQGAIDEFKRLNNHDEMIAKTEEVFLSFLENRSAS
jgi:glycosyltransferase involved in cell wall biosynthesis